MSILIKNVNAFLPSGKVEKTNIGISGNSIEFVGDIPEGYKTLSVIDGTDMFAVPGFVNAHTHVSMNLLRSYADDINLQDWLQKEIWPIEDKMTQEDLYWGAALGILEMIKGGTTSFLDQYGPWEDVVAKAAIDCGIRAVLSRGMIAFTPEDGDKRLKEGIQLYRDFNGAGDGRISVMLSPHAPYTTTPDFLRKVAAAASDLKAEVHIHLSETKHEVDECLEKYGKSPIGLMEETGILSCGVVGAHCVWVDDADIELMKEYHMRVAHNPGSNMKLASGIAPVAKLLDNGICVGIGTDGASSNNNLDMLEEIRLASLLSKVSTLNPEAIPAAEALKMGTEYGARAIGLHNAGRIEAGCKADITLFSTNSAEWTPRYDYISLLVYAASQASVDTVIIDGKLIMKNRSLLTIDEEKIIYHARMRAEKLTGRENL